MVSLFPSLSSNERTDNNHKTMVGRQSKGRMLMALGAISLAAIHDVKADVPFVIGSSTVFGQQRQQILLSKKVDAGVLPFGLVTLAVPRGGSRKEDEDEYDEGYDDDEINLTIDEEDDEEDFVDAVEVGDYEEAADDEPFVDTVTGFEIEDASEELDDDEQALLGEAQGAAPIEEFDEDEEDDDDFEDSLGEEEETMTTQEEVPLEDRMATSMATTDDESSAFVDRMELADAYDEGETTTGTIDDASPAIAHGGGDEGGDDGDGGMPDPPSPSTESALKTKVLEEITKEVKDALRKKLQYTKNEVEAIRPEIAEFVLANNLQRPDEGMPPNFYKKGTVGSSEPKLLKSALKAAVAFAAVGAAAFVANGAGAFDDLNVDTAVDDLLSLMGKLPAALAAVPAVITSMLPSSSSSSSSSIGETESETTSAALPETPDEPEIEDEGEEALPEDDHPHSIKPFTHDKPDEDLDKSWLDKGITKIENAIKGFLNIEI